MKRKLLVGLAMAMAAQLVTAGGLLVARTRLDPTSMTRITWSAERELAVRAPAPPPPPSPTLTRLRAPAGRHVLCDGSHLLLFGGRRYKATGAAQVAELERLYGPAEHVTAREIGPPPQGEVSLVELFGGNMHAYESVVAPPGEVAS